MPFYLPPYIDSNILSFSDGITIPQIIKILFVNSLDILKKVNQRVHQQLYLHHNKM